MRAPSPARPRTLTDRVRERAGWTFPRFDTVPPRRAFADALRALVRASWDGRGASRLLLRPGSDGEAGGDFRHNRRVVARTYLRGAGVEVGALHDPLEVRPGVRVTYVDRMSAADLRRHYPELGASPLVDPDVIDDGETLGTFADGSLDFVIANHLIEHTEDPIGSLLTFCRVVRPGGVLYLALPDKRHTFDRTRELTSFEHLAKDHEQSPAWSRRGHFEEWVRAVDELSGDAVEPRARELMAMNYSIHYHVWDHAAFFGFLVEARARYGLPFEIGCALRNGMESIFVLART